MKISRDKISKDVSTAEPPPHRIPRDNMPARTSRGAGTTRRKASTGRSSDRRGDSSSDDTDGTLSDSDSSTSQTSLFGAIEDGDVDEFNRIARNDPEAFKHVNSNGWTAAHQAAYSGEHKMLKKALEAGVDVNAKCADGCLAAHYASAQGEKKCLQVLFDFGSEMETKDNDGESPLDVSTNTIRELLADLIVDARTRRTGAQ